ncbi:MAG: bifunctional oligoribonuclease/PAP phosphatase NrnA [Lachnospiraceae bacterium]|nr:bifunctional oligoribonuclease/PAP phosphatase NrnA [Lachnospiraceae bacterium]
MKTIDILKECENAEYIGISGHIRPDGDCVGSCMALYMYLTGKLPRAHVYVYLEPQAKIFTHIAGIDAIDTEYTPQEHYDVFFCLDTEPGRLGKAESLYRGAAKKINIDHHQTSAGEGDICVVRPEVGSCAEVLYELLPKEDVDDDMALAIYLGIIHDTGVFQYSNTRPQTLRIAAELMEHRINFSSLIQESFYQKSWKEMKATAWVMLHAESLFEGKVVLGHMTMKEMKECDVSTTDLSGIVSELRNIAGVECAVFMYELPAGLCRVSLRTGERVDATKIAVTFDGGGHARAAGCSIRGRFEEAYGKLLPVLERFFTDCSVENQAAGGESAVNDAGENDGQSDA